MNRKFLQTPGVMNNKKRLTKVKGSGGICNTFKNSQVTKRLSIQRSLFYDL